MAGSSPPVGRMAWGHRSSTASTQPPRPRPPKRRRAAGTTVSRGPRRRDARSRDLLRRRRRSPRRLRVTRCDAGVRGGRDLHSHRDYLKVGPRFTAGRGRKRMSLRQFEYALAVAEEGSVTAAAELLHVAQPSMSQQIRNLERELGVTLFARTPTGLVPTAVGRAFLREAELAVSAARRATATARAGADELVGELVVAVQMGFGARQLPSALGALRRRSPRLEVTVFEE